ncbi:putative membrane protein C17G8.08c [Besnoitia besnoiti]|uniref:GDT1 family protein n=1 Tax=Besnoitia besnoiti TaxID=94643 RepID=A0A2A9MCL9_BESBE|nr:putative membrane protein C17G8.08c [Besnoitia besnoiti]PFH36238.1 putative membrane protein C17G8.08c [Besnoitia besnoiti]
MNPGGPSPLSLAGDAELSGSYPAGIVVDASFLSTFVASFFVIMCSELGDKTFLITALLAMKEGNAVYVFIGSISALWLMTGLSAAGGVLLPTLLSAEVTHWIMIAMLTIFGVKMLIEGFSTDDGETGEEMSRLEKELAIKKDSEGTDTEMKTRAQEKGAEDAAGLSHLDGDGPLAREWTQVAPTEDEEARRTLKSGEATARDVLRSPETASRGVLCRAGCAVAAAISSLVNPVFLQSFGLTFVAEWGDRSQMSTFALAASRNVAGVFAGAALGHALCTALAVIGGKVLAARISERLVLLAGGVMFILFAIFGAVLDV